MSSRLELVRIEDLGHVLRTNEDIIVYSSPTCVRCVDRDGLTVAEVMASKDVQGVFCLPSRLPQPKPRRWRVRDYMVKNGAAWVRFDGRTEPPVTEWDDVVPVSDWYTVTEVIDE
jgi:hypothetical protein